MEALREIVHLNSNLLKISVPDKFAGYDVEVIVFPLKRHVKKTKRECWGHIKTE